MLKQHGFQTRQFNRGMATASTQALESRWLDRCFEDVASLTVVLFLRVQGVKQRICQKCKGFKDRSCQRTRLRTVEMQRKTRRAVSFKEDGRR